jgi:hypothetical protein
MADEITEMVEEAGEPQIVDTPKEAERTIDELKAELDKLQRTVKNREEEAARVHAKLEKFEKEEQARKEAEMTEMEKIKLQAESAEKQLAEARKSLLKREVAAKVELPEILIDRLKGDSAEELEADAKKLLEELPKPKATISTTNPGSNQSIQETREQQFKRLFGSQN